MFSFIFSLLIGALAGSIAGRIMGSETSALRNIVLGILGSFVGGILLGLYRLDDPFAQPVPVHHFRQQPRSAGCRTESGAVAGETEPSRTGNLGWPQAVQVSSPS